MLNRRAFLGGVFGGVAAGGLIVRATPAEVDRFAAATPIEAPVAVNPTNPRAQPWVLYDAEGRAVCHIVRAQPVSMHRHVEDVTTHRDATVHLAAFDATQRVAFEAEVIDATAFYDVLAAHRPLG